MLFLLKRRWTGGFLGLAALALLGVGLRQLLPGVPPVTVSLAAALLGVATFAVVLTSDVTLHGLFLAVFGAPYRRRHRELAEVFRARPVKVRASVVLGAAALSYAMRLQPTEPGWVDMGLGVPLIDSARARSELGWNPRHDAIETLRELIDGMRGGSDYPTPPLARVTSGPLRVRELLTGVGARSL